MRRTRNRAISLLGSAALVAALLPGLSAPSAAADFQPLPNLPGATQVVITLAN
jgi:hypothetical protein